MQRKGLFDYSIWFWIAIVVTLLTFFLLYQIQQSGQRLVQSNIEIIGAGGQDIEFVHDDRIHLAQIHSHENVIENGL